MNDVAASSVLHLTAGARFGGPLNVDLSELSMNLVPFPRLHFLCAALAAAPQDACGAGPLPARFADGLFSDAFARPARLLSADVRQGTTLACALLLRGDVNLSDARRNVLRLAGQLSVARWARPAGGAGSDAFKLGLCAMPPAGAPASLFTLANSTAVAGVFRGMHDRFTKLRARRVFLHHYEEYAPLAEMDEAAERLLYLADAYEEQAGPATGGRRCAFMPAGLGLSGEGR